MELKLKIKPLHFCLFWLCLNLLQATFTQLTSDEGYYWFYSRSLEWGYYDHPPFLALIIKIGYSLFHNELGVRLFYVLLNSVSVFLLFQLFDKNDTRRQHFIYLIILSLPLFNYLSFLVFPDGPLLFFSLTFLVAYKRFLEKEDGLSALFMGVSAAFMMYSKYHAVLVIGFTVLSNLKLLRSPKFYAAMLLALLLFVPHLWWQYTHHFATFQYHLKGRSSALSTKHVFEYISQQLAAIGPGLIFIPFVTKTKDQFEKTLLFIIIGTFLFFLVSSLKDFIHFHWTSLTLFPLVLLASKYYDTFHKNKLFKALVLPFAFFLLLFRCQLMFPIFPVNHIGIDYYQGRDLWAKDIKKVAGNRPVFFQNNFRESALYSFYAHEPGVSLQTGEKRKSQYEIWHYEDSLQHKEVMLVDEESFNGSQLLSTRMGKPVYYKMIQNFTSYYDVQVRAALPEEVKQQSAINIFLTVYNRRGTPLHFTADSTGNTPALFYALKKDNQEVLWKRFHTFSLIDSIPAKSKLLLSANVPMKHLEKGNYSIVFGVDQSGLDDSFNSETYSFTVN